MENNKKQETLKLILVLCCAVISAIFLSAYFLLYYDSPHEYLSSDLLLSPKTMSEFTEHVSQESEVHLPKILVFEENSDAKKLSFEKYQRFYELIARDRSLGDMQPALIDLFEHTPLITLQIKMSSNKKNKFALQTLQILKSGDYYRIQSSVNAKEGWVYYSHPDIGRKIVDILNNGKTIP